MFARLGAVGATLAGALLIVGHLWSYLSETPPVGAALLVMGAHIVLFYVIVALYDHLRGAPTTEWGTLLAIAGNAVIMGVVFTHLGEAQDIAAASSYEEGTVGLVAMAGILAFTLGIALLGMAIANSGRLPSSIGGMFVLSAVLAFAGSFLPEIVFVAGAVIGGVALLWAGRELQSAPTVDRERAPAHV